MAEILVVYYSKSGNTLKMAELVAEGARKALELVRTGTGQRLRKKLFENVERLRKALAGLALETGESVSQIVPVIVGTSRRALRLSETLLEHGLYVPAVRPPTVEEGRARLRISVTALHRREHLDRLASALAESAQRQG